jgi:hypothetical protein
MIRDLLCLLGFHAWNETKIKPYEIRKYDRIHTCLYCFKQEWRVRENKKWVGVGERVS